MTQVAALYVQADGCYQGLDGIDPWDEQRDARMYQGPHPVVAHPPCHKWIALAHVNYKRWGGEHNRPGNDGGTFKCALADVRRWGGVLEHPAKSSAFATHGLPVPRGYPWQALGNGEWVCEVWQSAYGHRANKATWLFYASPRFRVPFGLRWDRPRGEYQVGCPQAGRENKPTLSGREANATPHAFRDELIRLALWSVGND